jgi:hypothetical protein
VEGVGRQRDKDKDDGVSDDDDRTTMTRIRAGNDDDGEDNNNGAPNVNDGRPSTHSYRCSQLFAGWTAGATDGDDTGIGGRHYW